MKELDSFTVERLEEIRNSFLDRIQESAPSLEEVFALIDIALAAKRAEPVGYLEQNHLDYLRSGSDADIWPEGGAGDIPVYLTPQLNSQVPLGSWIKCSDQMPEVGDVVITAYQGCTNVGQMERSGKTYRYFTSIASGRELPATHWMSLPVAPEKPL
ncbi:DUF551 domain-containing protein [Yersinia enterocolitica]|uniref:DUF551 domain-containing protein n=1 Tax=Yersinia enterocolitica TaxID=630 RepID=UPI001C6100FF|nr:DUF551 domain-containing protein [Yersinia enterocolitica]MBW5877481.1 DUF551 domain-containing protein [Yersinia enterocolitica]